MVISYPNQGIDYTTYACSGAAPARPCTGTVLTTGSATEIFTDWGGGNVLNSGRADNVEVKYTGFIVSPTTVSATFRVDGDDGQYLTFNGSDLITNCWYDKGSGSCTASSAVTLQANVYYPFTFWFYENGGGANTYLYWDIGAGNVRVPTTAFYRSAPPAQTYTVTYNYDNATGGNSPASATYTTGGAAITLPTPTRTGYTFGGWYSDSGLTTSIGAAGASYSPTASITAYAKWTANTYTVTYNGNSSTGGSVPANGTATYNSAFTVAANSGNLVRTGYTFAGWNTAADGTGTPYTAGSGSFTFLDTATKTLYAKWNPNTYTVTFNSQGGSSSGPIGYWNFNDSTSIGKDSITGTVLTATGATYTASGKSGGGLALAGNQYLSGALANLPTGSSGYTIGGWMRTTSAGSEQGILGWGTWGEVGTTNALRTTGSNGFVNYWWSRDLGGTSSITNNTWIHVIATYDGTTRRIYVNGSQVSSDSQAPPNVVNANFRIGSTNSAEWFNGTLDDIVIYNRGLSAAEITTLYTSGPTFTSWTAGTNLTLPATPTRSGFTFNGWYDAASGGNRLGDGGASYLPLSGADFTIFAQWTANTFTVTYNYNNATGGNGTSSATFTNGGTAITLPTPTRTGYTFGGWYSDLALTTTIGAAGASYSPTASITAYAKWSGNPNTVTYASQG
ncbi:MAG: hypothetical protein EBU84_14440, partial [Actinobacteria bacterium]|nr:hypothetical protein [Actinomycetota bacterium]